MSDPAHGPKSVPSTFPIKKGHDTTVQILDRKLGKRFYPKEPFQASLDAWKGVPLVFAQEHPDPLEFAANASTALGKVATIEGTPGRIVGKLDDPKVQIPGHPRLTGRMEWNDAVVDQLYEKGELSHSTTFFCKDEGDRIGGTIRPLYILLFKEVSGQTEPRDEGSLIENQAGEPHGVLVQSGALSTKEENAMPEPPKDDENKAKVQGLWAKFKALFQEANPGIDLEPAAAPAPQAPPSAQSNTKETENMSNQADKAELETLRAERDTLKQTLQAKETELAGFKTAQKDAAWNAVKAKLPPGLVHKDKEAEMRTKYENDKDAFYADWMNNMKGAPQSTGSENAGTEHAESNTKAKPGQLTDEQIKAELTKRSIPSLEIVDKRGA